MKFEVPGFPTDDLPIEAALGFIQEVTQRISEIRNLKSEINFVVVPAMAMAFDHADKC